MHDDYADLLRSARLWALSGGAGDDADDVASEAVTRLWRADAGGATWPNAAARYGYTRRAVATILIDQRRAAAAQCRDAAATVSLSRPGPDGRPLAARVAAPGDQLAGRLDLAEALAALGRNGRAVALQARGYPPAETGARLGLARRTTSAALVAGRAALRNGVPS